MKSVNSLMKRMQRIITDCVEMVLIDKNSMEFHMEDGSVISMTLKDEVKGVGKELH